MLFHLTGARMENGWFTTMEDHRWLMIISTVILLW